MTTAKEIYGKKNAKKPYKHPEAVRAIWRYYQKKHREQKKEKAGEKS